MNSQLAHVKFIAIYPDNDALDNDNDNDDGDGDKSYVEDARGYGHDEDGKVPVVEILFVEVLFSVVLFLAFVDKHFLGSLYNSLHLDYSILCGYQE
ncbi:MULTISPECIES: hypothetical protein [unclassified Paenibacillus]|uniref:hypothetical protein n=1 Tax=unclassified Paenibacillus TaxID=185978 RepID=UPI003625C6D5